MRERRPGGKIEQKKLQNCRQQQQYRIHRQLKKGFENKEKKQN